MTSTVKNKSTRKVTQIPEGGVGGGFFNKYSTFTVSVISEYLSHTFELLNKKKFSFFPSVVSLDPVLSAQCSGTRVKSKTRLPSSSSSSSMY